MTSGPKIREFMSALGRAARKPARIYFVGGCSAVLVGWRDATLDVDIKIEAEADEIFAALPRIKEQLNLNVELASPGDFIPELPGWKERSVFIAREGPVDFFHYDFYAQALAKVERAHDLDLVDVREMLARSLIENGKALELFGRIEPEMYRYPALNPASFRKSVERAFGSG